MLDWYSQRFNDHWGFPTTCLDPVNPSGPRLISNAIDADATFLGIGFIAEDFARNHPNCIHILTTSYACILCMSWLSAWELQYAWVGSSFVAVVFASWLLHMRGKANLPYLLAVLRIINPDDVHHGASFHHPCLSFRLQPIFSTQAWTLPLGPILFSSVSSPLQ